MVLAIIKNIKTRTYLLYCKSTVVLVLGTAQNCCTFFSLVTNIHRTGPRNNEEFFKFSFLVIPRNSSRTNSD